MAPEDRSLRVALVAGTGFFLLGGLFLVGLGARNAWWAWRSADWPQVPATITWSGDDLHFVYRADSRDRSTADIHLGQTRTPSDSSETRLLQLRYPEGAATTVRVHPSDPSVAVAEPGFHSDQLWLPGAGLFVAGVAFMFLLLGSELMGFGIPALKGAGLTAFGVIFTALGALGLGFGAARLWKAQQSQHWPSVPGEIVYQQLDTHAPAERPIGDRGPRERPTYAVALVFRYQVKGRIYYSNLRRFGQLAAASADWAAEIADRYPEGTKLPVYYDPVDPANGVIETGWNNEVWFLPGAGLAALLFGGAVLRWGRKALR